MTKAEDYTRFVVDSFASREGLMKYLDEMARLRIPQFTVHIRKDGLWEVCHPLPIEGRPTPPGLKGWIA
jgi:hypothetical protein